MHVEMGCVIFVSTQPALLTGQVRVERSWHDYWMGQVRVEPFSWILLLQHDTNPTC